MTANEIWTEAMLKLTEHRFRITRLSQDVTPEGAEWRQLEGLPVYIVTFPGTRVEEVRREGG